MAWRTFSNHIVRFLTLVAIMIVSVGFMSGVGEVEGKIDANFQTYYVSQNVSDLIVKSKTGPLSQSQKTFLTEKFGQENVMFGTYLDIQIPTGENGEAEIYRVYLLDLENINVNKFVLVNGKLPQEKEILVQEGSKALKSFDIGTQVSLDNPTLNLLLFGEENHNFSVSGVVESPLHLIKDDEPSINFDGEILDYVVFLNRPNAFQTDAFVAYPDRTLFDAFSTKYKQSIEEDKAEIEQSLGQVAVLSLYENYGIFSLHAYADKVGQIGIIFVVFFVLITSLVVFSTMTRLMDEERAQLACLKTLGFANFRILGKYLLFIFVSCIVGGGIGLPVGIWLTYLIYSSFNVQYFMPDFVSGISLWYFGLTLGIILVTALLVTFFTGLKTIRNKPAVLLTPKAPKPGKKVLLERLPFVWNRLSFKYKSTFRNVFYFKSRFLMTAVSIMGSTVLVLSGLGLLDCTIKEAAGSALIMLAVALIAFAGALSALVIYNLANINISERRREIATLMVLGYKDFEVAGYIYREIYIMSAIGAVLGLPLAVWFMDFIFGFIDFGSLGQVNWFTWLIGPVAIMIFTFLSTLLLYRKITKTNMNESLKTLD